MKTAQIMEKVFAENAKPSQIIYIFIGEIQVFDIVDHLFQPCADGISIITRVGAEKHIKDHFLVLPFDVISLHHGQFIQVCQQSQILLIHD